MAQGLEGEFLRGDINVDASIGIDDVIHVLKYLFVAGETLDCDDAADVNDDGSVDIGDAISLLFFMFLPSDTLPPPYHECGVDPTPDKLSCDSFSICGTPRYKKNTIGMQFLYIHPGTFQMGSPVTERGRSPDEVLHQVTITCGFYLGKYEVTEEQFSQVMGTKPWRSNPGLYSGPPGGKNYPAVWVTWNQAVEFCRRLSERERQREAERYRLPTEAEWEYACRAGTQTRFSFGDALECEDDPFIQYECRSAEGYLWMDGPARGPVDFKLPNPWGLYGMNGNVGEWCNDWYAPYSLRPVVDPTGPPTGLRKVFRASESSAFKRARSAWRGWSGPEGRGLNIGFRVVQKTPCESLGITP